jgi:biopolymer transport protein ExbD
MAGFDNRNNDDIIANINVTPLVDIMLVLLIIFMLVSTFMLKEAIEVELPHAATSKEVNKKTLSIIISKSGEYFVGDKRMESFEGLRARMADEKKSDPELQVIISADRQVLHGTVVEVIDMIRRLELYNFAINVEYEAEAP